MTAIEILERLKEDGFLVLIPNKESARCKYCGYKYEHGAKTPKFHHHRGCLYVDATMVVKRHRQEVA